MELLHWAFDQSDQWIRERNGLLESRLRTVRVGWQLSEVLNPELPVQAVRRREVLERVAELLDDFENVGRFADEERQIRQRIDKPLKQEMVQGS